MDMRADLRVIVTEASQVGEARRRACTLARASGLDERQTARVALVVTEAATNLVKHAGGGEVLFHALRQEGGTGFEILALDRGHGMQNAALALRDGYSSAGTLGTGLGAIVRQSDFFDLHSPSGSGCALLARIDGPGGVAPDLRLEVGGIAVPARGEEACGDAWAVARQGDRTGILVVDGLGHGPLAAEAAEVAVRVFQGSRAPGPAAAVEVIHLALRPTRGAAVAVAEVDLERELVRFAGIGNVAGVVVAPSSTRHMVSLGGIAGHSVRRIDEFTYSWPASATLLLHTDGLASHWDLGKYPGLVERHPSLIAGVLYRDHARGRDDAAVVVARPARR
jgi:anti-sigma regulatory factor (Ser/Thr protein kinase)